MIQRTAVGRNVASSSLRDGGSGNSDGGSGNSDGKIIIFLRTELIELLS